jgi:hypothetical protein
MPYCLSLASYYVNLLLEVKSLFFGKLLDGICCKFAKL